MTKETINTNTIQPMYRHSTNNAQPSKNPIIPINSPLSFVDV